MKNESGKNVGEHKESQSVRVEIPMDAMGHGTNTFKPGTAPRGGFHSTWDFSGSKDYKNSPTGKPNQKVI
jgi:hypothetical protein